MPAQVNWLIYHQGNLYGIALEKGWLKQAFPHTQFNLLAGSGASPTLAAFESGGIDIGELGSPPTAVALAAGNAPMKVFWVLSGVTTSEALVVRTSEHITSAQGLRGKTVGVPSASTSEYALIGYLALHGMTEKDIKLVYGTPQELSAAWSRGALDAMYTWQPFQQQALNDGGTRLIDTAQLTSTGWGSTNLELVRTAFADKYPAFMKKFVQLMQRCYLYERSNPAQADAAMGKWLGMTSAQVQLLLTGYQFVSTTAAKTSQWLGGGSAGVIGQELLKTGQVWHSLGRIPAAPTKAEIDAGITTEFLP
ncbi:MAG: taurine ABC transporter substrate-binding protein [Candidatus Dormibacteria bacterium]